MSKKSRKLIRSTPTSDRARRSTRSRPPLPYPAEAPKHRFFFLPDVEPGAVDEQELHDLMKLWRHGRATRTIGQVLQDGYVALFSVVHDRRHGHLRGASTRSRGLAGCRPRRAPPAGCCCRLGDGARLLRPRARPSPDCSARCWPRPPRASG